MYRLLLTAVAAVALTVCASAQVPQTMSMQGEISGSCPNCTQNLTFRIYDVATGGTALWTETQSVAMANRMFNVILGSSTALGIPFDEQYWIGIVVGSGTELSPRIKLTSAPYSLRARSSDGFTGNLTGDVTSVGMETTVTGLQERSVAATAPTDGQVLTWNATATAWGPSTLPVAETVPAGLMMMSLTSTAPAGYEYSGITIRTTATDTWRDRSITGYTNGDNASAATVNGKIYVMTNALGGQSFNEEYDPATNTWASKSTTGWTGRNSMVAVAVNDKIYAIGGHVNNEAPAAHNEEYDPSTNTWATMSTTGFTPRRKLGAAAFDDKIYVVGGRTGLPGTPTNVNEMYDPATDTWTTMTPDFMYARSEFGMAVADGYILAVNGNVDGVLDGSVRRYNPVNDNWGGSAVGGLTPRSDHVVVALGGKVYSISGRTSTHIASSYNEEFDPVNHVWKTKSSEGFPGRNSACGAVANGRIYIFGGVSPSGFPGIQEYTPEELVYLMIKQ